MSTQYLLDNSAWARLWHPALPEERRAELAAAISERRVHACLPFVLEAGYSARSTDDYAGLRRTLGSLPFAAIEPLTEERAVELQGELVQTGHHRLPPVDVLIAAIAEHHGLTVLHVDKDFDVIRDTTSALLRTEWLAPPATFA